MAKLADASLPDELLRDVSEPSSTCVSTQFVYFFFLFFTKL